MLSGIRARAIREASTGVETYWKPFHKGTMMAVEFEGSGKTQSGLHVVEAGDRRKFIACVLVTNECATVKEGDIVLFEDGTQEPLRSMAGDEFVVIREDMVTEIVTGFLLGESA